MMHFLGIEVTTARPSRRMKILLLTLLTFAALC